jgi:hypothetical protein
MFQQLKYSYYLNALTAIAPHRSKRISGSKLSLCVGEIMCAVTLANSGKWPDDVGAIRRLTAALYREWL